MQIKSIIAKQINSTYKRIITVDDEIVAVAKCKSQSDLIIGYLNGAKIEIKDICMKNILDKFLKNYKMEVKVNGKQ